LLKKILISTLAIGALALNAPIAHADNPPASVGCRFNGVTQATATGQDTWESVVEGWIVGDAGTDVSVYCEIRVSGGGTYPATAVPAPGNTVAVWGPQHVTYVRTLTQSVQLCAVWTDDNNHESGETCAGTTTTQIPPQEVLDLLQFVFDTIDGVTTPLEKQFVDPIVCPVIDQAYDAGVTGVPGVVELVDGSPDPAGADGDADVYVAGALFYDCPGYEPVTP
jgi:hypothetical protein